MVSATPELAFRKALTSGAALTNAGAYGVNSDSAYGTNDQAGNVWEWNDAVISGSSRGLRGGSWNNNENNLCASNRNNNDPSNEYNNIGFRVARPLRVHCLPIGEIMAV